MFEDKRILLRLQRIDRRLIYLTALTEKLLGEEGIVMAQNKALADALNRVQGAAANETTQINSMMAMITTLGNEVRDLTSDQLDADTQAQVDQLFNGITQNAQNIQSAIVANTPQAAPAGTGPAQAQPAAPGTVNVAGDNPSQSSQAQVGTDTGGVDVGQNQPAGGGVVGDQGTGSNNSQVDQGGGTSQSDATTGANVSNDPANLNPPADGSGGAGPGQLNQAPRRR